MVYDCFVNLFKDMNIYTMVERFVFIIKYSKKSKKKFYIKFYLTITKVNLIK